MKGQKAVKIHLLREHATEQQIREMLEAIPNYIKLAVDIEAIVRRLLEVPPR